MSEPLAELRKAFERQDVPVVYLHERGDGPPFAALVRLDWLSDDAAIKAWCEAELGEHSHLTPEDWRV